jgi:DNA-binding MarR family transcriptional regulator
LAPAGIGAAQFGVLVAVAGRDGASLTELAQSLDMDRTTLTRNLRPLERAGHLRLAAGADKRSRAVGITAEGRAVLARARPLWRNAQRVVAESLGAGDLAALHSLLEITLARLPAD